MSKPRARLIWTAVGLLAVWVALHWWQTFSMNDAHTEPSSTALMNRTTGSYAAAATRGTGSNKHPYLAALAHAEAHRQEASLASKLPETDQHDPYAGRFDTPDLATLERFSERSSRLLPDASCLNRHEMVGMDAEQRVRTLYAIDPAERYPRDYFFRTFTQFFRQGDEYMQVAAVWDVRMPPVYRIDFFSSPTADFTKDVISVAPPIAAPTHPDGESALEYIAALTQLYQRQGAQIGQRIIEAQLPTPDGQHEVQVTLADQRVQSWGFQGGLCRANRAGDGLHCRCVSQS